jgi:hypothetical protein
MSYKSTSIEIKMIMKLNSKVKEIYQNSWGNAINNDPICPKYAVLNGNDR